MEVNSFPLPETTDHHVLLRCNASCWHWPEVGGEQAATSGCAATRRTLPAWRRATGDREEPPGRRRAVEPAAQRSTSRRRRHTHLQGTASPGDKCRRGHASRGQPWHQPSRAGVRAC
jgi:hypothetical protein